MDTLVCKICHQTSRVTPSTQKVRCPACGGVISVVETRRDPVSSGKISRKASTSFNLRSARISDSPPRGKRALLCGISYKNQTCMLRGATQDVMTMSNLLVQKFNFPANSILILSEESPYEPPTKNNILRAFGWLMKGLQSGDSLFFYFAGHGQQQKDSNGDEDDGFDEAICPLDYESEGLILDDEINETLVRPLKRGVILHAIIDACYSGSVLDLPYVCDRTEWRWKPWKCNHPPSGCVKGTSGGQAICFSACRDSQVAAESADTSAVFSPADGSMTGAMTNSFKNAILEIPGITYVDLLDYMIKGIEATYKNRDNKGSWAGRILGLIKPKASQVPLLSSSQEFNVRRPFKL